ncbi:MAG: PEP-CTERM sorting domain-containing protein [Bryobacteraceae bacterium]
MKSVFVSLRYAVPVVFMGLAAASQASAAGVCSDSVLTLVSAQVITGSGGAAQCSVSTTLPGLIFSTSAPIHSVLSEANVPTVAATWIVAYTGTGPASTTVAYDVLFNGSASQPLTWGLDVGPTGGSLAPVAGGGFLLDPTGSKEFSATQTFTGIEPGSYTFEVFAFSNSTSGFNVSVPGATSIDLKDPTPNGVPEPASIATLGIGLAAGLLFLSKRRKKQ